MRFDVTVDYVTTTTITVEDVPFDGEGETPEMAMEKAKEKAEEIIQ